MEIYTSQGRAIRVISDPDGTFQTLLHQESILTTNSQILSDRFVIRAVHTSSKCILFEQASTSNAISPEMGSTAIPVFY